MSVHTSPEKHVSNFDPDISKKMRVPNKIKVDYDDDIPNGVSASWSDTYLNINMQVPERILVAGQDQHIGTRAPPHEMVLDNSLMCREPESVRVYSPPRVITLDKYSFPVVVGNKTEDTPHMDLIPPKQKNKFEISDNDLRLQRDSMSPVPTGHGLSTAEEIRHLRKQMAKLHRRIVAIELDNLNRMQKEKIIYGIGIAYFLLKAIMWLRRS